MSYSACVHHVARTCGRASPSVSASPVARAPDAGRRLARLSPEVAQFQDRVAKPGCWDADTCISGSVRLACDADHTQLPGQVPGITICSCRYWYLDGALMGGEGLYNGGETHPLAAAGQ